MVLHMERKDRHTGDSNSRCRASGGCRRNLQIGSFRQTTWPVGNKIDLTLYIVDFRTQLIHCLLVNELHQIRYR